MPLFDIFDEVAQKQIEKTDLGENRMLGVYLGKVTSNFDMTLPGMVRVTIYARDYDQEKQVWARMSYPYSGSNWGEYFCPEVGDQVLIAFENGNISRPYIIGSVPKSTDRFAKGCIDMNNANKKIRTKNGNSISFVDKAVGEGAMDKITISTSTDAHQIELNNEGKQIVITDKSKSNQIVMKTETGQMEIKAQTKLTIKVGETIELTMNGNNGTVLLKCNKLKTDVTNQVQISANNNTKIEGGNVSLTGNSMLKLESSGPVNISGTPIKLG
ncbi:phage baseplate assembly protein V [Butyrivibrio sp. AE2015]|uniref:phage baseplate assembly protein V n=1 Tax=Butyrivibrio sp. AE2015 TaxID=1280663 RepID=UPI0003B5CD9F|nr:phage baseplate assembly protein V [Butyrivibrio sp. AE2015]